MSFDKIRLLPCRFFEHVWSHTWASLQSWEGYPPPEFFLISTPPLQEGLSWAKYSPPRKNFWANYLKISPPRKNIFGKFQENSGILVKSCKGYPPLWGWKIYPPPKNFQKNIPPFEIFEISPPPGSRVLAHVWIINFNKVQISITRVNSN